MLRIEHGGVHAWCLGGRAGVDVRNPTDPSLIKSVATDRGSHTHSLVPQGKGTLFICVSSYGLKPGSLLDTTGCHDITVMKALKLAAAACLSVGQIWDLQRSHPTGGRAHSHDP
jgi:hypothetical protein